MIDREKMPQIPRHQFENFWKYLDDNDTKHITLSLPVEKLKPIQKAVNKKKVDRIKQSGRVDDILVSKTGHVLDGHHRYVAAAEMGRKHIRCFVIMSPTDKAIEMMHNFEGSERRGMNERVNHKKTNRIKKYGILYPLFWTPTHTPSDAEDNDDNEMSPGSIPPANDYSGMREAFFVEIDRQMQNVMREAERNYKREYKLFHSKPKQKKRRAERNASRRKMERAGKVHKNDGKDVDHKNNNTADQSSKNLQVISKSTNRSKK